MSGVKNLIFPQPQASQLCVSPERGWKKAGAITAGPRFASAKRRENLAGLVFAMILCSRGVCRTGGRSFRYSETEGELRLVVFYNDFVFARCVPDGWSLVLSQRNGRGIIFCCVVQGYVVLAGPGAPMQWMQVHAMRAADDKAMH